MLDGNWKGIWLEYDALKLVSIRFAQARTKRGYRECNTSLMLACAGLLRAVETAASKWQALQMDRVEKTKNSNVLS